MDLKASFLKEIICFATDSLFLCPVLIREELLQFVSTLLGGKALAIITWSNFVASLLITNCQPRLIVQFNKHVSRVYN